jgi:TonB-dependent SusC/RagA subfamily outer membrane receptor
MNYGPQNLKSVLMTAGKTMVLCTMIALISEAAFAGQITASVFGHSAIDKEHNISVAFENEPPRDALSPDKVLVGSISGTVTDAKSGEPLPGANVRIEELSRGAATDEEGNYTIEGLENGAYTIKVSFIGYDTAEESITVEEGENTANFSLKPNISGLSDVVVTGIASRTSKAISEVSVSKINAEELTETNNYTGVSGLLNGKVAGVNVQSASGSVGSGIRFKMRSGGGLKGTGQPVIYIDGVRIDDSEVEGLGAGGQGFGALADINPEEIESVDILKGPAASALYGTGGSNGVVLITTKSGTPGESFQVGFKSVVGFNEQKAEYDEFLTNDAANGEFRRGAIRQNLIDFSGSAGSIRYYTSVANRFEEGILRGNDIDRTNIRANIDAFPTDNLTINVSSSYAINTNNRQLLDNAFGPLNNTLFITDQLLWSKTGSKEAVYAFEDILETNRFIGSLSMSWNPFKNFELRGNVGYDESDMREDQTEPFGFSYGGDIDGTRGIFERQNEQQTYDLNARYSYQVLSDLDITSVIGTQIFNRRTSTITIDAENFPTQGITNIGAGEEILDTDETLIHSRSAGVFTSHQFNYKDTYLWTLAGRQDYSSSVGNQSPNIFYPKVSAAIRIDKLANNLPLGMNFLKIRAAYGESGQLPEVLDGAGRLWGSNNSGYGAAAILEVIGNSEIEPERVKELEFGVEADFFEKLSLDLTYYRQNANKSIIEFQQSPSTGLTADNIPFNVGKIDGSGIELGINAAVIETQNSSLDLGLIWNWSENEVQDLGQAQPIFDGDNVIKEGLPRSAFYPFVNNGALFNEDGTYAGADVLFTEREFIGNPYPKHDGSFSINFNFKNFNLYILNQWAIDLYILNSTAFIAEGYGNYTKRLVAAAKIDNDRYRNVWEAEFPNIQQFEPGTPEYREAANEFALLDRGSVKGYLQKADWFKVRELSVSYNLIDLMKNLGAGDFVRKFDITASATNLFNYSLYEGPDPEVHWQGARTISQGEDFTSLQQPRTYNLSISLGF